MLPGKVYTPEDVVGILRRRFWLALVPMAIAAAGAAVYAHRLPDRYRSDTLILVVPQRVPESYVRSTVTSRIEDRLAAIAQQILSRTRLERIITEFDLYRNERRSMLMEDVVDIMRTSIAVLPIRGDAFTVAYIGDNPRAVQKVTERLASLFIEESLRDREVLAEGTTQFLDAQLEDARRRLIDQEKKLEEYRKRYAGQLPNQVDSNLQALNNTQLQSQQLLDSLNRDYDRKLMVQRQIADLEQQVNDGDTDGAPVVAPSAEGSAAQQLAAAKATLAALGQRLKQDHPDMQRMRRVVRELEKKAEQEAADIPVSAAGPAVSRAVAARAKRIDELQAELQKLNQQIEAKETQDQRLRAQSNVYQQRVEMVPTRESEMVELMRDYGTLQSLYASLLSKREDSKISANLERRQIGEQFRLLDPARVPERPFAPDRRRITLMGAASGLGFGFLLIALLEYRENGFKTDEEIVRILKLPVLAVVPFMQSTHEKRAARLRRGAMHVSLATTVAACAAVVVYALVR